MQHEFESKLAMIKAVQYALNSNSDIVSSYPKLIENINTLNEFVRKIPIVQNNNKAEEIKHNHVKSNPEEYFSRLVIQVVNHLNSFASMVENVELMTETIALKNELHKFRGNELLEKGKNIYHHLIENFLYLEHFGVQESTIKEFEMRMKNFDKYLSEQDSPSSSKSFIDNNDISIDGIVDFIEDTLDEQIRLLRMHYPKFYSEYQKSRAMKETKDQSGNGDWTFKYYY